MFDLAKMADCPFLLETKLQITLARGFFFSISKIYVILHISFNYCVVTFCYLSYWVIVLFLCKFVMLEIFLKNSKNSISNWLPLCQTRSLSHIRKLGNGWQLTVMERARSIWLKTGLNMSGFCRLDLKKDINEKI